MKKLHLNPEDLCVKSFVAVAIAPLRGTVQGRESEDTGCGGTCAGATCATCQAGDEGTKCEATCPLTCKDCGTYIGTWCQDTCRCPLPTEGATCSCNCPPP